MRINAVRALPNHTLEITADDGSVECFDVEPYLAYEAFRPLNNREEFAKVSTGGYFIEWECGADLSADTIEANLASRKNRESQSKRADITNG